ncbi:cytochrome P450 [Sulfitobacter sp. D35]|uniref:cytochrome P450 n=1 Tax=Sulfitobacter sp. D35 TaxID=3083252 RepID=UPI00297004D0|nr:cytochrome P450 [Sulfitobacter sp. D35]MDW4498778.1 cytochrome P450 [Sulfitobacter sp. D35]
MNFDGVLRRIADHLTGEEDDDETLRLGHEVVRGAEEDPDGVESFVSRVGVWAKEHPGPILNVLRKLNPVLTVKKKNLAIVGSFEGVTGILANHRDFAVTYGEKMKKLTEGANFFLGEDDDSVAAFDNRAVTTLVFRRTDASDRIPKTVRRLAQEALNEAGPKIDAVQDYLRPVAARFAMEYFGLRTTTPDDLYAITEILFEYLFIDLENTPDIATRADAAGARLRELLDREIADTDRAGEDTVISRGLALIEDGRVPLDPVSLRNNLLGLLIGLVPTTPKAAAMGYDYLTVRDERADILHGALDDPDRLLAVIREGMRLNPINPGLLRKANRTVTVPGHAREEIDGGMIVFVATSAAMRDPDYVEDPEEIRTDRPGSVYLNNGLGLHACFGRYINDSNVFILLSELLHAGYRRIPGENLQFDGPYPAHLPLARA